MQGKKKLNLFTIEQFNSHPNPIIVKIETCDTKYNQKTTTHQYEFKSSIKASMSYETNASNHQIQNSAKHFQSDILPFRSQYKSNFQVSNPIDQITYITFTQNLNQASNFKTPPRHKLKLHPTHLNKSTNFQFH